MKKALILTLTIIMVLMTFASCGAKPVDKCTNRDFFESYVPVLSGHNQRVTDGMDGDSYFFYLDDCDKDDFDEYTDLMRDIDIYSITNVEYCDADGGRYEIRTETVDNANNGTGHYTLCCFFDASDKELFITADWIEEKGGEPITTAFEEVELETEVEVDRYSFFVENVPEVDKVFPDLDWYVLDGMSDEGYWAGVETTDKSVYDEYVSLIDRNVFNHVISADKDHIWLAMDIDNGYYEIYVEWYENEFTVSAEYYEN